MHYRAHKRFFLVRDPYLIEESTLQVRLSLDNVFTTPIHRVYISILQDLHSLDNLCCLLRSF